MAAKAGRVSRRQGNDAHVYKSLATSGWLRQVNLVLYSVRTMKPTAQKASIADILPLRALYLQETNFQIRYHACHERGWTDSYLLTLDDRVVGYGSIKGREVQDRDTVFEYYVAPPFGRRARELFEQLLAASGAEFIECQSNDLLLSSMIYEFSSSVSADVVLFGDHAVTEHRIPGVAVRLRRPDDQVFEHKAEPVGEYVAVVGDEVVGTGGFLLHYNRPFADLYMEVREDFRGRGIGSYLVQEIKRECYLAGRVPAARTSLENIASRATLLKSGLKVCGFMLTGKADRAR
jgi:GNAT superfamily N-acetyltransferase